MLKTAKHATAQIIKPSRAKLLHVEIHFRTVGFKNISGQYDVALDAFENAEEFDRLIESLAWLVELTAVQ